MKKLLICVDLSDFKEKERKAILDKRLDLKGDSPISSYNHIRNTSRNNY